MSFEKTRSPARLVPRKGVAVVAGLIAGFGAAPASAQHIGTAEKCTSINVSNGTIERCDDYNSKGQRTKHTAKTVRMYFAEKPEGNVTDTVTTNKTVKYRYYSEGTVAKTAITQSVKRTIENTAAPESPSTPNEPTIEPTSPAPDTTIDVADPICRDGQTGEGVYCSPETYKRMTACLEAGNVWRIDVSPQDPVEGYCVVTDPRHAIAQ